MTKYISGDYPIAEEEEKQSQKSRRKSPHSRPLTSSSSSIRREGPCEHPYDQRQAFHLMRHKVGVHPDNGLHTGLRLENMFTWTKKPSITMNRTHKIHPRFTSIYHVGST